MHSTRKQLTIDELLDRVVQIGVRTDICRVFASELFIRTRPSLVKPLPFEFSYEYAPRARRL